MTGFSSTTPPNGAHAANDKSRQKANTKKQILFIEKNLPIIRFYQFVGSSGGFSHPKPKIL
jgi:hypothetical protein